MYAYEIRNLKWISVTDWSELPQTYSLHRNKFYVCESDVDSFVDNVFKDVSRRLNMSYSELKPILETENSAFYSTKDRLFRECEAIPKNHARLLELENLLQIPDITPKSNVEKILNDFSTLTDIEKLEVLQRLGLVNITVSF